MASSGEPVPSPCSQAGNNPVSWDWGPRQIPKLLAGVSAHLELRPSGPREPCVRLQLLAARLHLQALGMSLRGTLFQVCLVEGSCSAVGRVGRLAWPLQWPWQRICPEAAGPEAQTVTRMHTGCARTQTQTHTQPHRYHPHIAPQTPTPQAIPTTPLPKWLGQFPCQAPAGRLLPTESLSLAPESPGVCVGVHLLRRGHMLGCSSIS